MEKINIINPKEINSQKQSLFTSYRSNSLRYCKNKSSLNYEHIISFDQFGEKKKIDLRNQYPLSHVRNSFIKSATFTPKEKKMKTAFEKAEIQEAITKHATIQKHQNLLREEKKIKNICYKKNQIYKRNIQKRKENLKNELTRIIKDAIQFSKKNNAVRAMLPGNIDEIVDQVKKETQNLSINLSMSQVSRISRLSSNKFNSMLEKNDFLNSLGIDTENLNSNTINIDIDKCWNHIVKIAKGRKVEDILRYKVVNTIMNLTEKKSAEKAKKIYEKLDIYKKYKEGKRKEEIRRKKMLELKRERELKADIKEYIKQKMYKSLSEKKNFKNEKNIKNKYEYNHWRKNKKIKRADSAGNINFELETQRKYTRLNAYNDVNKIISFIDKSKKKSQSKIYRNHFKNIKLTKDMDKTLENMINKNEIKLSNVVLDK